MALYHKHRPQKFADIVGQEHIVQTLGNQIRSGRTAHAYLFFGPRGVGKTTLARILAKSLNCPNRTNAEADPCDNCETCREIASARSIDVIEMDAASHTQVENVRENIIENSQFKPTKSKYKIFIIDEVHMLSNSSFNALLKTLEEPPAHVIFILATTDPQKLPATIISRCQRFSFLRIPANLMKTQIEKIATDENFKIDREVIDRIIAKSEGCDRDALGLLEQLFSLGEKHITSALAELFLPPSFDGAALDLIAQLADRAIQPALDRVDALNNQSANFLEFSEALLGILHDLLHTKVDNKYDSGANASELRSLASKFSLRDIVSLSDIFLRRRGEIKHSPIPSLPIEMAVVEWCADMAPQTPAPIQTPTAHKITPKEKIETKNVTNIPSPSIESESPPTEIADSTTATTTETEPEEAPKEQGIGAEIQTDASSLWPNFVKAVEMKNPALIFILKMAHIKSCTDKNLTITVPYEFHHAKLEEKSTKLNLETILSEVFGRKLKLSVAVESAPDTNTSTPDDLATLAADFGGVVVG